jgi:protein TonB
MKRQVSAICLLLVCAISGAAQSLRKLSHGEALAAVVTKISPVYPPMARQLKIEGAVEVDAVIGEDGQVESVSIVSGNPMLTKPAADALRKWKFTPQTQDGKAVRVVAPIDFSFKL